MKKLKPSIDVVLDDNVQGRDTDFFAIYILFSELIKTVDLKGKYSFDSAGWICYIIMQEELMKRLGFFVFVLVLLSGLWACDSSKNKYLTEITALETLVKQLDVLRGELDATNNRTTFGKSIVDFLREYKRLKPELNTIRDRWPEFLTTTGPENPPEELKPYFKKVSNALAMMKIVLDGKAARFGGNEDVRKIVRELREVMYYY